MLLFKPALHRLVQPKAEKIGLRALYAAHGTHMCRDHIRGQ